MINLLDLIKMFDLELILFLCKGMPFKASLYIEFEMAS